MDSSNTYSFGLALGGGGPRGIAHIGALQAFEDLGIQPDIVAGTSVGAIVSALYAFGVPLQDQRAFAEQLSWWKISKFRWKKMGIVTNEPIKQLCQEFLENKKIEDANIPIRIMTCDITSGEPVVLSSGDVGEAIRASSAIPGLFAPVEIDNKLLVDGGVVENIPISPLLETQTRTIIAIDLMTQGMLRAEPKRITDIMLNSFHIIMQSYHQPDERTADLILNPKLSKLIKTDKQSLDAMYDAGYTSVMENKNSILKLLKT